jgi:signal transduction histidine kinase
VNPSVRGPFALATLALLALYGGTLRPAPLVWGLLAVLCLLYQAMIWVHERRWTRPAYALVIGTAITVTAAISLADGGRATDSLLLIPPVLLLAKEQRGDVRRFAMLLAVATLGAMLALSRLAPFSFAVVSGVVTLYVCIRAINIYKDAHRASQLHLAALDAAHQQLRQAHAELQEASALSMRYAALVERTRLAREMHDGLGHHLTSLIVQLQALEIMLAHDPERAAGEVRGLLEVARRAMAEVRGAVDEWREDERGLGLAALQGLVSQTAARSHLALTFQQEGCSTDWPVPVSAALYRIVQEGLTNIMRHAGATSATVRLEERDGRISLSVADDGRYTADTPLARGFGLRGIEERSEALGGTCTLAQNAPHGLLVRVVLPLDGRAEDGAPAGPPAPASGGLAPANTRA